MPVHTSAERARRRQGGGGLAAQARSQQGVPEEVVPGTNAPDQEAMSEILQMLRGGQVGSERLLQLLSLLAGSTLGQGGGAPQERPRRQGRDQARRPREGQASIRQLLS